MWARGKAHQGGRAVEREALAGGARGKVGVAGHYWIVHGILWDNIIKGKLLRFGIDLCSALQAVS